MRDARSWIPKRSVLPEFAHPAGGAVLSSRELAPLKKPGDYNDGQSRYLEAAVNGLLVASIYAPNGNPQPGPKFDYKLAWLRRLAAHTAYLYVSRAPVVLAGDYNVVPTDLDIYRSKSWDRDALLQPESRAAYQRLLSQGWTDAIRALHPKEPMFTFWDYKRNRWERDGGLRLDHILLTPALTECLQDAGVDRHVPRNRGHQRSRARMGEASRCAYPPERSHPTSRRPCGNCGTDGFAESGENGPSHKRRRPEGEALRRVLVSRRSRVARCW